MPKRNNQAYVRGFVGKDGLQHEVWPDDPPREYIRCPDCGVWIPVANFPQPHKTECDGPEGRAKRERLSSVVNKTWAKIMKGGQ